MIRNHSAAVPFVWQDFALCRGADPSVFFPDREQSVDEAKALCFQCPVQQPCLWDALRHGERYGVWGGLGESERRVLARRLTLESA